MDHRTATLVMTALVARSAPVHVSPRDALTAAAAGAEARRLELLELARRNREKRTA